MGKEYVVQTPISGPIKVIPQYCIAHPYCARFLASLPRAHSARTLTTWRFLYETKPAREINGNFLLNEHGDLSFFLHYNIQGKITEC